MYEFLDRRYALALYEACVEAGNVEVVLQQLKEIVNEMNSNKDFMKIIENPQISKFNKKRIFKELFEDSIEPELMNFLLLTIEKKRILFLKEKYYQFKNIYLNANKIIIAEVKTAVQLNDEEKNTLKIVLEKKYRKTVVFKEKVDKSIIGGIVVRIGDEIIDGSIKERLTELKKLTNDIVQGDQDELSQIYTIRQKKLLQSELGKEPLYAEVTTAIPLTGNEKLSVIKSLEEFYDRKIVINEIINKDIIGGILVKIGEDVIDYTVREKLKYIQKN